MAKRGFILTDRFIDVRTLAGLRQADLAERAGTDQATISRLEAGALMSIERARRLAGALNRTLEQAIEAGLIAWSGSDAGPVDVTEAIQAR